MKAGLLFAGIVFAAAATAGNWTPYAGNPVLGNGKLGTCFDVNVVTDGPAPYTMYFSWRPKKAIALVRSTDGFNWTQEPEICLAPNPASGWEDLVNRSVTVKKDGVWHMWYTGQVFVNGSWREGWSRIGYATSTDGVRFTRVRREPVMVPELPFEKTSVMNPYVRWDAKRALWRMWYAAGEIYEPNVLCYAESRDGLRWEKRKEPVFEHGEALSWDRARVGACEVHPLPDGRWAMFYIGYSDIDTARIGCAISADGITGWRRLGANPLVAPDLGTWNGSACYKPSCVRDEKNNRWMLWYNGRNGAPEYVGMAVHEGLDLEAPARAPADLKGLLSTYVRRFNAQDVEHYTNAVPNSAAEDFMLANCPRFACPDKDVERTYYFRWWTFRKHLRRDTGRWLRDPGYMSDLATFANDLHAEEGLKTEDERRRGRRLFTSLLWQYADAQRRTRDPRSEGGYDVVPWIDENLNPDRPEWLARQMLLATPSAKNRPRERGKDYNHSTFCDLVISGLVGFMPDGAKGFTVDPLFPATWDYLVLENLRYRGHDIDIRWQRGEGLTVYVDGQEAAASSQLKRVSERRSRWN